MNKHITEFVGIDLGDKKSMVHIRNQNGEFVEELRISTTQAALVRTFGGRKPLRIALEVGGHSRWVSAQLKSL